jgi:SPP1 gp7 family putative phage head morphogenesis protein
MVLEAGLVVVAYTDRLMRALEPLLQERYGKRQDAMHLDAAPSLDEVFAQVQEGHVSREFLGRMFRGIDQQAANDLSHIVPISPDQTLRGGAEMQAGFIERNTELIQMEERLRKEVRAIIERPIAEGVRVEEIRAELEERMGITRRRAELIARDQTLKTYGQIQEARQTDAGIEEYTWSTSDDERVRESHKLLDGTTQRWDSPPVVDPRTGRREHPGGDFQCRCASIPILPTGGLDEPPESGARPSVRPLAVDIPPELDVPPSTVRPSVRSPAVIEPPVIEPPPGPDPVELERQRLAEQAAARAAEEAERQRLAEIDRVQAVAAEFEERRLQRRAAAEAERQRLAAQAELERLRVLREAEDRQQAIANRALEHAEGYAIQGKVSEAEQNTVLNTLAEIRPRGVPRLGGLELAAEATGAELAPGVRIVIDGEYTPHNNVLRVTMALPVRAEPLSDLVFATSHVGDSAETVLARMVTHEYGHHVHVTAGARIDRLILEAYRAQAPEAAARLGVARGNIDYKALETAAPEGAVSRYGTANHLEFFAEAFTSYMHDPEWMLATKPAAHKLVTRVLEMLR